MLAEVVGGILSGSMALLADAGHMLTDAASLMLAWSAVKAADRTADEKRTYGYHRAQVLAAFVNGLALLAIVAWIIYESINRLYEPVPVIGRMMLIVASIGLLVNLLVFYILHRGGDISLNLRSAALHVLGDLLGSVAAIAAGIVIIFTGWSPIDPLLSIFVAMLILRGAWSIVKTAGHILMEGTPDDFDEESLRAAVKEGVPGVTDLHHIHAWVLADQRHLLTMHVQICQGLEHREIIDQINDILKQRFAIDHATIQLEEGPCHDLECPMA
jgi:cobalt-zinc-cadmium efflux system protein